MDLLATPELWIGIVAFAMLGFALMPNAATKKRKARLARILQRRTIGHAQSKQLATLRRANSAGSTAFGQVLASMSSIAKLQARLEAAGMQVSPQKFFSYMGAVMAIGFFVMVFVLHKPVLLSILAGVLLGIALPHLAVGRNIKKRQVLFLNLFPEAIDLMVRGLRAGLPVAESFQVVSRELPPPMGDTFATISQQMQLGMPMEKALSDAAQKNGLTEFNFFVTTIILQRETGGNLGEILNNLSEMLRQRHMMKLKIGALSSEARASAFIVGSLPFLVFVMLQILSPHYLRPLFDDYRGNMSLLGAMCSMSLGGFIMKKMTQLEI